MKLRVEVVRALPTRQRVARVELDEGSTARDAVEAAGITAPFAALGRFGKKIEPETILRDGDRIELLRPLREDPKDARRRRAARRR
jgi:putative ubiquitin-RnfH superfamily antitoxin RatB of RatAB toxin-antitoxin module